MFTHDQGQIILFAKTRAGSLMVAPLFIDEENSKLLPKYSYCVKFVAFRHS